MDAKDYGSGAIVHQFEDRRCLRTLLVLLFALAAWFAVSSEARAQNCSNPANAIVAENCLPGTPQSEWDPGINGDDPTLVGFADDISVNVGQTINFKVRTDASAYTMDIYRLGYYGGDGARKITSIQPNVQLSNKQPACLTDSATNLVDCGNWAVTASWTVPSTATSGIYFVHLIRPDTQGDNLIVFIVRNDASHSNILFQTSDETWEAYNEWQPSSSTTGYSLYGPTGQYDITDRAYKVSYNRPYHTRDFGDESLSWFLGPEYAMVRWLEANGYDVTYFTGVDAARNGSLMLNHKIYMTTGHDEYVSGPARANITAARNAGINMAFFSGNEDFWKTRWENSIDGTNTQYRTLVCYKETYANAVIDPDDPPTWTGTWRDPRFSPPGDGGQPENALDGTIFMVNGPGSDNDNLSIKVPEADGQMRFWRNTRIASLSPGTTATLPAGTLGYEWDEDLDNGFRPAGTFDLSTATYSMTEDLLLDYGETYGAGTATHHMTMYRASSGALVFGAGTVQWSFGLDGTHDNPTGASTTPDPDMQQATVNLFADMGVQPGSLQPGLTAASASTDLTPPTSTITSPAAGSTITSSSATITGTAVDSGGGVVAGVEVSVDGGKTWHPATGRGSWSYKWQPSLNGSFTIESRAVDDSGNIETPSAGVSVTVSGAPCSSGSSIWNCSATPQTVDSGDGGAIEVGVAFQSSVNGYINGIRFYKASTNTGTHIGNLWSNTGALLATATFTNETSSGWQQVNFSTPVEIVANTIYIASYHTTVGHYSADQLYFEAKGVSSPPLEALQDGVDGSNGVYSYSSSSVFPTSTYNSSNYWVDVVFASGGGSGGGGSPSVQSVSPANGATGVNVNTQVTVTFSEAMDASTINSNTVQLLQPGIEETTVVPATVSYNSSTMVATLVPTDPLSGSTNYTVTVEGGANGVQDANGQTLASNFTSSFTTWSGSCPCSIWSSSSVPGTPDSGPDNAVELGVKFQSNVSGTITGIRFYKGTGNTGTHVGNLWTSSGTLLASATFANETASGWQQVSFSTPVAVSANTTYVASYHTNVGHYSDDKNFFATHGVNNGPLEALASGVDGLNGVYAYGSTSAFPSSSYSASNYWVDVGFTSSSILTAPSVMTVSPANGANTVSTYTSVTATFTEAMDATTINSSTFQLVNSSKAVIPSTVSYNSSTQTATLTPSGPLSLSTTYTATIEGGSNGVKDSSENPLLSNFNWSFTTWSGACPCSIWTSSAAPQTVDSGDASAIEVGVKFTSDFNGSITGLRFYKSANNTGTHVGNLWTSTGTLLATATFSGETASGWQQVSFSSPVAVTANTVYVASYHTSAGHYSGDANFFASHGVDTGPLHALASGVSGPNGVYAYASNSTFPSSSYNSSNYWVDVVFSLNGSGGSGPAVSSVSPANGATGLGSTVTVTATFDESMDPTTITTSTFQLVNSSNVAVPASVTYNNSTQTATLAPSTSLSLATTYTATVHGGSSGVKDLSGNTLASDFSWSFSTWSGVCPCSVWSASATPGTADGGPDSAVELGVKFRSDLNGYITGIRFYKSTNNTGTHVGNLWTSSGTLLATATFSGETASGWQQVTFSTPVAITANTVYVASYHTNVGHYSADKNFFASQGVDKGPLHALANGVSGGDGVYGYGSTSTFPNSTYNSSNYWVDVVFNTASVTASPSALTFASQQVNTTSADQTVTLSNSGSSAVTITSVAVSGDFAQTYNCGSSLAAGSSCAINVTFTPTATGARTGTLTVTDSDPSSPQTVSLSGTGQ
jgi:hypothetical protein